jgi:hypothetical protein
VATFDILPIEGHDFVSPNNSPEILRRNHSSRSSRKLDFGVDCSAIIVIHCCLQMQEFKIEREGL